MTRPKLSECSDRAREAFHGASPALGTVRRWWSGTFCHYQGIDLRMFDSVEKNHIMLAL
jgi:hypothetical protein